jgi:predicted nucleic acid-binding protein
VSVYLDASVILPMLLEEPASEAVDAFLLACDEPLIVSEFAASEVASAASRLVRTGRLTGDQAASALADFDAWRAASTTDIDLGPADIRLAHVFVRRFNLMLRTPDALHAAICRREGLRLVTCDRRLAHAAEALGVGSILLP